MFKLAIVICKAKNTILVIFFDKTKSLDCVRRLVLFGEDDFDQVEQIYNRDEC